MVQLRCALTSALTGAFVLFRAPERMHAQIDASVALGTWVGFSNSQPATAALPGIGERAVVLRQRLRVPWIVGAARLGYRLGSSTSLELGYAIAPVKVSVENPGVPLFPASAAGAVHTLALRPRIRMARIGIATVGHAFAGPALVWRSGGAFADNDGTLRGAANLGVGLTFDAGAVEFRADLEDVIYTSALRRPDGVQAKREVQHDIQLTVGIVVLR